MNLWLNSDGNLIVGDSGNPILCDTCPCVAGACGTCASSYTIVHTASFLVGAAIVTFTTTPTCTSNTDIATAACVWEGTANVSPLTCGGGVGKVFIAKPAIGLGTAKVIVMDSRGTGCVVCAPAGKDVNSDCPDGDGGKYFTSPTNWFTVT